MASITNQELHAVSQALAVVAKAQRNGNGKKPAGTAARRRNRAPSRSAKPKSAPVATRALGEVVLAQGVGRVPRSPFRSRVLGGNLLCWDAFHEAHAPLPRAVGPYAVVRTTRIFNTNYKYMIFGTAMDDYSQWTTTLAWGSNTRTDAINTSSGTYTWAGTPPGATSGDDSSLTAVPSAMSVQVLNPSPIESAGGIMYAAVCPTQLSMVDNTRTWGDFEQQFTSYMKPRLMSGGKLALRGVQMNSYPLNMSSLSSFEKINSYGSGTKTWASGTGVDGNAQYLTGFAPMVVINDSGNYLTYAVTVEYRVRFDIGNPAVASHRLHGVTPDKTWDSMIHKAIALGNGVKDIVEMVATMGQAVSRTRALMP